jgi:hypothetical protein
MSAELLNSISKYGGAVGKVYSVLNLVYKQFYQNEKEANEFYRAIYPGLKITFVKYGRDSEEFNNLLLALAKLAPTGAKRSNFTKRYLTDKEGWKQLPSNPDSIIFGYWW